ncbi:hypothetical protein PF005_g15105 [Phytophthora fragariae]|uniref:Uncharacterized protein n=1 Tax=Phytophthora fragariae TaxID=53985 RepID=A0A6A3JZR4_9STRA|nr:hypothetical protein PF009_g16404 [Phytophthora fragariae]KAE9000790.1 hypothetical protein PF011_g14042 [Phytophthora fragariae]KAE9099764.1 hypothetical protein PF007_g15751 [Phytophthora fragariae]KAE9100010.1 hypothetical protein PF010_g14976 [Phytophthora fragariae]KAE9136121.1 hypothetical protein PF006_g14461 [Phytophthora fragariae]
MHVGGCAVLVGLVCITTVRTVCSLCFSCISMIWYVLPTTRSGSRNSSRISMQSMASRT